MVILVLDLEPVRIPALHEGADAPIGAVVVCLLCERGGSDGLDGIQGLGVESLLAIKWVFGGLSG